ncbi:zinc-dependent alcohol dehydrogenase family protein [Stutzerimonas kirkiae]|uniref:zinc-dependent alcohol dehydrogenase family protein n=1 Tax=Stutzerimonas kirkiae TaxID=2211392 RepID=UPI0010385B06|nr:zinc-dependent alcohol dehydrogenase family protein [Stutzerimonas kirkiae]TBV06593.1 alcohol dehydrogenase [Stutzerimonas kirkiae]TBV13683.1 alcohol dehydrogenase [Stutzerimonas kirkiae]
MSRIIRFHQFGAADVLRMEQYVVPRPGPGEVSLDVEAIAVSWYDVLWRQNLALSQVQLPAGLGHELAGVVRALGEGVDDLAVGDRVASFPAHSPNQYPGYAERVLLPRASLVRYPGSLDALQACGHYTPLLIGWFGYVDLAAAQPGESVLVTAAGLCAGPYIVQLGKALGLRVIAAVADEDEGEYARELGADAVVNTEAQDLVRQVLRLTDGRGVDIVLDALGGPQMSLLGDALAPRGRLVLYGLQGGNQTPFPACAAFQKNIRFFVHCLGNFTGKQELQIPQDRAAVARALEAINGFTAAGKLRPQIGRVFPFEAFVEAHRHAERCTQRGRLVLALGGQSTDELETPSP